jgi:hypothetical protein
VATYDRPLRGDKDKISGRFFYDNVAVAKPFGTASTLAFPENVLLHNRFVSITETHVFSSRQANELRIGYSRFFQPNTPTDLVQLSDIGATRPNISSVPGMYRVSITGLYQIGTGVNDDRTTVSNNFYYGDTWSLIAGRHSIRAGGEATRYQLNRSNRFSIRGALGFDQTADGYGAFANFLQGRITTLQSGAGDPQRYFRDTDWALFFQDDIRVRPRFTLNVGLRWDFLGFAHDLLFRSAIYDPTLLQKQPQVNPFRFAQALNLGGFTGTPGVSDCTLNDCTSKHSLGPRLGFAWDVTGNQKLIVRSGFGIYYERLSNQNLLQGSLTAPFFVQLINRSTAPAPFELQNPLASQPPSTAIATAFIPQISNFGGLRYIANKNGTCPGPSGPLSVNDPCVGAIFVNQSGQRCSGFGGTATNCVVNLASFSSAPADTHPPYTEAWNFSIQRDLGHGWGLELAYVGAHNIGGIGIYDPFLPTLASPTAPINLTDINGNSYAITTNTANNEPLRNKILGIDRNAGSRFVANIGQSIYHSGQVSLSHRFMRGLFFQAAYTWSKEIDNVSGSQSTDELNSTRNGQGGANILNDQSNPSQNRAVGDFDRPHRLIVSYTWDIPAPRSGMWGTKLIQGWAVSGIVTYQSGLPFSTSDGSSGGAFGTASGTGMLICNSVQITSLPTCTPGTPTTLQQVTQIPGSIESNLNHFINPNMVSQSVSVPNSAIFLNGAKDSATGFGNIPRNAFRGPFQQDWDFSASKTFRFAERNEFQFRADFFNLFNHPIFNFPASVNVGSPATFGQINTTVLPARLIQFGLKYSF